MRGNGVLPKPRITFFCPPGETPGETEGETEGEIRGGVGGGERGVTTGSKIMFSLSSVILSDMLGVDSCVFLIFTTRVGLKTRLNGVKSIFFVQSRKF
jgi:hypothetical protein